MKFRPCIDIHNGKVKQIIGGTIKEQEDFAEENFVSEQEASYYAKLYQKDGLTGGHIILLNAASSDYYKEDREQALKALKAYPGGMQVGGGITLENGETFLKAGASHVIVTSYVFQNGKIHKENLKQMVKCVGKEHLVLDLSCRKKNGTYYIVTNRWNEFTEVSLERTILEELADNCDELLVHAVDVEGKQKGIDIELVQLLASMSNITITYAGGICELKDIEIIEKLSNGCIDITIGSALDLFGGKLNYQAVVEYCKEKRKKS